MRDDDEHIFDFFERRTQEAREHGLATLASALGAMLPPSTVYDSACRARAKAREHVEATARAVGLESFESSVSKTPAVVPFEMNAWLLVAVGGVAFLSVMASMTEASLEAKRIRERGVVDAHGWWRPAP